MLELAARDAIWEGITPCAIHPVMSEDGCAPCGAELAARGARLEQMSAEAAERMQGIATMGGPQMPPWVMLEARMEVLIDSILTNPRQRMQFEGEVGRRMLVMIKDVQAQTKQPTLHVPTPGTNIRNLRG